jgi:hypothetical protein
MVLFPLCVYSVLLTVDFLLCREDFMRRFAEVVLVYKLRPHQSLAVGDGQEDESQVFYPQMNADVR